MKKRFEEKAKYRQIILEGMTKSRQTYWDIEDRLTRLREKFREIEVK